MKIVEINEKTFKFYQIASRKQARKTRGQKVEKAGGQKPEKKIEQISKKIQKIKIIGY